MNKPLKPNLLDPLLTQKIVKTLKPQTQDYWGPTKNFAQTIYQKIIKPNIYFFLFILFIIIVLLFRYRNIKLERENREYMTTTTNINASVYSPYQSVYSGDKNLSNMLLQGNLFNLPDADMAVLLYEQQKELLREPKLKRSGKYRLNESDSDSKSKKVRSDYGSSDTKPGFAYPVYPNFPGGTLSAAKKR